jgi:flagellar biosynthesis protein FlhF
MDPPWMNDVRHNGKGSKVADPAEDERKSLRREVESLRLALHRMEEEWGTGTKETVQSLARQVEALIAENVRTTTDLPSGESVNSLSMARDILLRQGIAPSEGQPLLDALSDLTLNVGEIGDEERVGSLLQFLVARNIRTTGSFLDRLRQNSPVVCVFAGPSGVGKTTTIAKLAAGFTIRHGKKVLLVNLDTYRIGALEQLRIYGDLMGLPVEVASTPDRLVSIIREARDKELYDVILIDSAGGLSGDDTRIHPFVSALLLEDLNLSVSLVLSAAHKTKDIEKSILLYQCLAPSNMILTKLDETESLGSLYPILSSAPLPVSYVTMGQRVPDDIDVAHSGRMSQWIIGGFR